MARKSAGVREIVPEMVPTFEPETDDIDPSLVIVDVEQARELRSDVARAVAARAKGSDWMIQMLKKARAGSGGVFEINPYDLWLKEGWNRRNFNTKRARERIASYALSISKIGVRETLIAHIEDNRIVVHSGWNRLLATYHAINVLNAEVRAIPVRFGRSGETEEDRMLSQIVNNTKAELTRFEQGAVIATLTAMGWDTKDIAAKIGRSETNVKSLLALQELPFAVRELVETGAVSAYFADQVYRNHNHHEEKTLRYLNNAVAKARSLGLTHARPIHGAGVVRKTRTRNDDQTRTGSTSSLANSEVTIDTNNGTADQTTQSDPVVETPIPKIIEILRASKIGTHPDGPCLIFASEEAFETLTILAKLPEQTDD